MRRHPDGTLHPGLATAWQRTGPTTWRLTLRPDVRWHDGTRFTAVDAKYSLDRTFDPSVKAARLLPLFQTIDRTEAPDPGTLVIHTKRPDVLIPARLAGCGSRSSPGRTSTGSGSRCSTSVPWEPGRSASCRGPRASGASSRPTPTTGTGASTSTAWSFAPCPSPRRASTRCSAATRTSSRSSRPEHSRARGRASVDPGGRSALRRALRARGQRLGGAAQPPARPAGPVAGDRSGGDREGTLARARPRAERADPPRGQSPRSVAATPPVRSRGGAGSAPPGRLPRRARRPRDDGRLPRERQGHDRDDRRDVGGRRRQRRRRGDRLRRAAPEEPAADLQGAVVVGPDLDPAGSRRHDGAAPEPRPAARLLAASGIRPAAPRGATHGRRATAGRRRTGG